MQEEVQAGSSWHWLQVRDSGMVGEISGTHGYIIK
jgi:hypothetical protein